MRVIGIETQPICLLLTINTWLWGDQLLSAMDQQTETARMTPKTCSHEVKELKPVAHYWMMNYCICLPRSILISSLGTTCRARGWTDARLTELVSARSPAAFTTSSMSASPHRVYIFDPRTITPPERTPPETPRSFPGLSWGFGVCSGGYCPGGGNCRGVLSSNQPAWQFYETVECGCTARLS